MNSRFHVRSRVFGGRRARSAAPLDDPPAAPAGGAATAPGAATTATAQPPFPGAPAHPLTRGTDPVTIDTMAWDQAEKSAAYFVPGRRNLLVDAGSALSAPNLIRALDELDVERLDFVALTHIHPDQAGGAGLIAERFPEATFLVHPDAAGHVADPSRLIAAMKAMGGERTVELFGRPRAVDPGRIRAVAGGERVDLGDRRLEAIAPPGHTAAHLAWLDHRTEALFCGDALGIRVPGSRVVRPATPPSDFSHRQALDSIQRLRATGAGLALRSHFGPAGGGLEQECDRAADTLNRWLASFRDKRDHAEDAEDLTRRFNATLEANLEPVGPAVRRSLELISPAWLNLAGMSQEETRDGGIPGDSISDAA